MEKIFDISFDIMQFVFAIIAVVIIGYAIFTGNQQLSMNVVFITMGMKLLSIDRSNDAILEELKKLNSYD